MSPNQTPKTSSEKTRKAILDAAASLFVKQGFAGTSISQIAEKAQINKSLIYHHYESKEKLWRVVLSEAIQYYQGELSMLLNTEHIDGKEFIRRFLRTRLQIGTERPEIQKMFYWLYLEENNSVRKLPGYESDRFIEAITHLQEKNQIRKDLHPRVVFVLLSAQANGLLNFINNLNDLSMREECINLAEKMLWDSLLPYN